MGPGTIESILGRENSIFDDDIANHNGMLSQNITGKKILVIGGGGTIGSAFIRELINWSPDKMVVVDPSENSLVEVVRDIRSGGGFQGTLRTLSIPLGSREFEVWINQVEPFDYIANFSALKHVRSERDPWTLMRMIRTNVINVANILDFIADKWPACRFYSVSTDKAANPANLMGATKNLMESVMVAACKNIHITSSRFANVAFSDGSLPYGFLKRLEKKQPLSAPNDIRRYFLTPKEGGQLCLLSCFTGESGDIFFPDLDRQSGEMTFDEIARALLKIQGYSTAEFNSEEEARAFIPGTDGKWPCYFSHSNTTGEKDFEEFYTSQEEPFIHSGGFNKVKIIKKSPPDILQLKNISDTVTALSELLRTNSWNTENLVDIIKKSVAGFNHIIKSKNLDEKM
ncbi:MAG: polysaccharide biosynthesis protein [Deltaproteobacteria bacterium]|nr:polysaccharide biosynthesis protein [Deltaproteobacteria bacterium]